MKLQTKSQKKIKVQECLRRNKDIENTIVNLIRDDISPALAGHDGSCELLCCAIDKDKLTVMISYQGSCASCGTSTGATLSYIENYLREELAIKGLWTGEVNVITTEDFKERAKNYNEYGFLDVET